MMKVLIGVCLLAAPAFGGLGLVTISKVMLANSTGDLFTVDNGALTNLDSSLHCWYQEVDDGTDGSTVSSSVWSHLAAPCCCTSTDNTQRRSESGEALKV
jgi:hypothetical protein